MPIHVDVGERRQSIAEATFRVAARHGMAGVTLRSVAAELGASTTVITNYLPTRADLLVNAVDVLGSEWMDEVSEIRSRRDGIEALREVIRSAVDWDDGELMRCQFWVAVMSSTNRTEEVDVHLAEASGRVRNVLEELLDEIGAPDPQSGADMLFLFAQGVAASIVEAPDAWPRQRTVRAADLALSAVVG